MTLSDAGISSETVRSRAAAGDEAGLAGRPFFREVGYSACWEDPAVLRAALRVQSGDRVLSIASAGCNLFALLLDDPAEVLAVDFNPHQLALVRLKMAAMTVLPREELLELLGVRPSRRRWASYLQLRSLLPPADQVFWEARRPLLERGLHRLGRTDRYLLSFGRLVRAVFGTSSVKRLFAFEDLAAQHRHYRTQWDGRRWRLLFRLVFHRQVLMRAKDPSHFRYVEADHFGLRIHERVDRLFASGLLSENYFVALILRGAYLEDRALPPYLSEEALPIVRARLNRIELRCASLSEAIASHGSRHFDAFNLSNLYDWLSDDARAQSLRDVVSAAREGARLCYWSTLFPRPLPNVEGLHEARALADRLAYADRFPYAHFTAASVSRS
ncbi:MAG: DUF3419 family protein [Candidatus Sericytochromatia bacterium]|nr:DUF3419 family protein [Candidatus Sericytochromatia bacterium]